MKHTAFFEKTILFGKHDDVAGYRCPALAVTGSESLLCFALANVSKVSDSGVAHFWEMRRSMDGGNTWLPAVKTDGQPTVIDATMDTLFSTVFSARDDQGKTLNETFICAHPEKLRAMGCGLFLRHSTDEGRTWSEPEDLSDQIFLEPSGKAIATACGIQLRHGRHAGRLVVAARNWFPYDPGNPYQLSKEAHDLVVFSDDHGKTWRFGGTALPYTGEACVVELSDGGVYLNSRNHHPKHHDRRAWAISRDGGETFTEFGYDDTLIEPICHASMVRYSSPLDGERNRILFCNPANIATKAGDGHNARKRMTVRLSYDDCKTWSFSKLIDPGFAGYSAVTVAKDKTILCAYEKDYLVTGEIALARFNLEWLTDGKDSAQAPRI